MDDIVKIVTSLEDSGLLMKGLSAHQLECTG